MFVNADFSRRAVVEPDEHRWVSSPQSGVERVMLDRVGAEKARATSIVRYAPGSGYPRHVHPGGEEILVLDGTFSEGADHYPAGWYLRNPPGSSHQPSSADGSVVFVKLWQMAPDENRHVRIDTRDIARWTVKDGRACCPLFEDPLEHVSIERLPAGTPMFAGTVESAEMLVLAGGLLEGRRQYSQGSWIRLPAGSYPEFVAGRDGVSLYLRTGPFSNQPTKPGAPC